jgi:hypothetical protein
MISFDAKQSLNRPRLSITMINVYPYSKSQPPPRSVSTHTGLSPTIPRASTSQTIPITVTVKTFILPSSNDPISYQEYRGEGYPPHDLGQPGDIYIDMASDKRLFARTSWWQE